MIIIEISDDAMATCVLSNQSQGNSVELSHSHVPQMTFQAGMDPTDDRGPTDLMEPKSPTIAQGICSCVVLLVG